MVSSHQLNWLLFCFHVSFKCLHGIIARLGIIISSPKPSFGAASIVRTSSNLLPQPRYHRDHPPDLEVLSTLWQQPSHLEPNHHRHEAISSPPYVDRLFPRDFRAATLLSEFLLFSLQRRLSLKIIHTQHDSFTT